MVRSSEGYCRGFHEQKISVLLSFRGHCGTMWGSPNIAANAVTRLGKSNSENGFCSRSEIYESGRVPANALHLDQGKSLDQYRRLGDTAKRQDPGFACEHRQLCCRNEVQKGLPGAGGLNSCVQVEVRSKFASNAVPAMFCQCSSNIGVQRSCETRSP